MRFNSKEYSIIKTKKYLKKNKLVFFFNGVNRNSNAWIKIEQALNILGMNYFKIFNRITKKELKNSTFKILKEIINGPTFFIKSNTKNPLSKDVLLSKFCPLLFLLLAIKINNRIYPLTVLKKNLNSIDYTKNILVFYQFNITNFKYYTKLLLKMNYSK